MPKRHTEKFASEGRLKKLGLEPVPLSLEETNTLRDAWRRIYARPLKKELGVWERGGFDWHVFSYKHTYALAGDEARDAYLADRCKELIILPNNEQVPGCRVRASEPPRLDGEHDVYMAFTHEDGWLGPYFSRAIWVATPPSTPDALRPKQKRSRSGGRR
jgi:hypothetical protein